MSREYIITMTAANRVGILSAVTRAMSELGGDLREASQTVVRGFFTMIFSAEFPDEMEQQIVVDHLQDTCRPFGIDVNLQEVKREVADASDESAGTKRHVLRLGGDNRPGVLRELSAFVATRSIDIAGMHAIRTREGKGFEMIMKIAVPADMDTDQMLTELNTTGQSFNITADLSGH